MSYSSTLVKADAHTPTSVTTATMVVATMPATMPAATMPATTPTSPTTTATVTDTRAKLEDQFSTIGHDVKDNSFWWQGPMELLLDHDWYWQGGTGSYGTQTTGTLQYRRHGGEVYSDESARLHLIGPNFTLLHSNVQGRGQTLTLCYVLESKRRSKEQLFTPGVESQVAD